ncbi:MAG: FtsX-like permease family protein [bacterium]
MLLRLALRNLLGAGLRTWLNVVVLSMSFVAIIGVQGLLDGMNRQAADAVRAAEYGGGQYWHPAYDPYDPFTLDDAHGPVPAELESLVRSGRAAAILVARGSIYPLGRMTPVLLKGIDPAQAALELPAAALADTGELPLLVGNRMAQATGLHPLDAVTVQWRDRRGTFDARLARVAEVMSTTVPTVDNGQVWLPLERLRQMLDVTGEATLVVLAPGEPAPAVPGWVFRDTDYLLSDLTAVIRSKGVGSAIIYTVLLLLAMLAIFDTQVLSLFRRRREIGTLMALGMTRGQVIALFTLEGALHGVLAGALAALWGFPLLRALAVNGWTLPPTSDSYGFAVGETLFPQFTGALVLATSAVVLLATTVVSFLPTRRIARLKPTDALRGRLT